MTPELDQTLLAAAVAQSFNSIVITDASLDNGGPLIEFCNPAFCRMTGYSRDELIGQSPRILQGAETDTQVIDELRRCLHAAQPFKGATINYRKDGTAYNVEWSISPIRNASGELTHFLSVQQNMDAQVIAERQRDMLADALDVSSVPVLITDVETEIIYTNRAFEQMTGFKADEVRGRTPNILRSGQHDAPFYEQLFSTLQQGRHFREIFANRRKDGSLFYSDQSITPIRDHSGRVSYYVSIATDVTEQVLQKQELQALAAEDRLTGLLNRRAGETALQAAWKQALEQTQPVAILMGDIDHFKAVNDSLGHPTGDRVLQQLASVIRDQLRGDDRAVRWGGEEFLLIAPNAGPEGARQLAERIRRAVAATDFGAAGPITISMGVACSLTTPLVGTPEALIANADRALYQAKHAGRNRVEIHDPATEQEPPAAGAEPH